jgi:hypothetical protein
MNDRKIFCIGLNKTGTSSLHRAFEILGFSSVHHVSKEGYLQVIMHENKLNNKKLLTGIDHYDAYSDWAMTNTKHFFKTLDKEYPGSKFIYNTRPVDDWIKSRTAHVKSFDNLEKLQKEQPENNWFNLRTDIWKQEFKEHEEDVTSYFKERKADYLHFDVTNGSGWEELCNFIQVPIPNTPFPNLNKSQSYYRKVLKKLKKLLKRAKL